MFIEAQMKYQRVVTCESDSAAEALHLFTESALILDVFKDVSEFL